jgi:predicted TIM-barrel fold metal-dependent hydrolase
MPTPVPTVLARLSSEEYRPLPWTPRDRAVLVRYRAAAARAASRLGLSAHAFATDRRATAAALRAIDAAHGGGFYDVPAEAELDDEAAAAAFDGPPGQAVLDVQTHLANVARWNTPSGAAMDGFLRGAEPERWPGPVDPARVSAVAWAQHVFGESETAAALLTSTPGRPHENILTNPEIAAVREITERYAGTGRVLTHTIVHPNLGAAELDRMVAWRDELQPTGWKAYTLWAPPEVPVDPAIGAPGWYLDDEGIGLPFLERVRDLGPRRLAVHKGIGGLVADASPVTTSPRDVGPVARAFPEITFLVYHSGYEPDPVTEEGAYDEDAPAGAPRRGTDRLVASLAEAGVGPGANVYAELGSTWFLMLRKPREAAHVLGKLLRAVGPERVVWGTDCIWYGSPQPLIDAFRSFQIPEDMQERHGYPALTEATKTAILGTNAAAAYDVDLGRAAADARSDRAWVTAAADDLARRLPC